MNDQDIILQAIAARMTVVTTTKADGSRTVRIAPNPDQRNAFKGDVWEKEKERSRIYARRRRKLLGSSAGWIALRKKVLERDGGRCVYCGSDVSGFSLEVDHILAVTSGGQNELSNLVTACKPCNSSKRNAPVKLWMEGRIR